MSKIKDIKAAEILDSRANPTLVCKVLLDDGSVGTARVPAGASRGKYEAHELRDKDAQRYGGMGALSAVSNVNGCIRNALIGEDVEDQEKIDLKMCNADGTQGKKNLGANAILSVSMAVCDAAAKAMCVPLYSHIASLLGEPLEKLSVPTPMLNVINGGAHAENNLEIQEFMLVPVGDGKFSEKLQRAVKVYKNIGRLLKESRIPFTLGDEGGFAPSLSSDEAALELLSEAIEEAGFRREDMSISLDAAAGEWYEGGRYLQRKRRQAKSTEKLIDYFSALSEKHGIFSIEDALAEDDYHGYERLSERLGKKVMLVGDDLFVTNAERLEYGAGRGICNAILIKPNQIGTVSEVLRVIRLAKSLGYTHIVSHRSGETEDSFIADLAVGTGAKFIKSGAPRGAERLAKYNRLLEIEAGL